MSTARRAFNVVYNLFDQRGVAFIFNGHRKKDDDNNTFLLEHK